jgi:arylsulfatase A-like enzyme
MKTLNAGILAVAAVPGMLEAQERIDVEAYLKMRPNVVMIYADDLGYGDLECYGATGVRTPNVNRLSEHGVRFTNAYAVAATSTPSRYSLLTGEYPWRKRGTDVAAGNAAMIISPDQHTVADVFKEAGYTTAAFGKWHLGLGAETGMQDWNAPISPALADIGFDYSYIMAATADRVPCVFIENGAVANYDPSAPIYVNYNKNFEGEPTGAENPELLYNLKSSHGHNNSIVNGIGRIGYMKGGGKALWKDEDIADSITVHAVDFIKKNRNTPFFMYFATNDVHVPRFPHPRFRGKSTMGLRGDAIVQFDWCVGEIVRALEEQGLLENTVIILTSDNGPVLDDGYVDQAEELVGEHSPTGGLRGWKYSAYEGGTRVPFIIHWPAVIKKQAVKSALVSQIDFLDVMARIAGVGTGVARSTDGFPGEVATWFGKNEKGRPFAVGMAQNHTLTLRTETWKFIEPKGGPAMIPWGPKIETGYATHPQIFKCVDGAFDEHKNMATEHPDIVAALSSLLEKIRHQKYEEIGGIAEP